MNGNSAMQKGEIALTLTLIGVGIMAVGILVGSIVVRRGPTQVQPQARHTVDYYEDPFIHISDFTCTNRSAGATSWECQAKANSMRADIGIRYARFRFNPTPATGGKDRCGTIQGACIIDPPVMGTYTSPVTGVQYGIPQEDEDVSVQVQFTVITTDNHMKTCMLKEPFVIGIPATIEGDTACASSGSPPPDTGTTPGNGVTAPPGACYQLDNSKFCYNRDVTGCDQDFFYTCRAQRCDGQPYWCYQYRIVSGTCQECSTQIPRLPTLTPTATFTPTPTTTDPREECRRRSYRDNIAECTSAERCTNELGGRDTGAWYRCVNPDILCCGSQQPTATPTPVAERCSDLCGEGNNWECSTVPCTDPASGYKNPAPTPNHCSVMNPPRYCCCQGPLPTATVTPSPSPTGPTATPTTPVCYQEADPSERCTVPGVSGCSGDGRLGWDCTNAPRCDNNPHGKKCKYYDIEEGKSCNVQTDDPTYCAIPHAPTGGPLPTPATCAQACQQQGREAFGSTGCVEDEDTCTAYADNTLIPLDEYDGCTYWSDGIEYQQYCCCTTPKPTNTPGPSPTPTATPKQGIALRVYDADDGKFIDDKSLAAKLLRIIRNPEGNYSWTSTPNYPLTSGLLGTERYGKIITQQSQGINLQHDQGSIYDPNQCTATIIEFSYDNGNYSPGNSATTNPGACNISVEPGALLPVPVGEVPAKYVEFNVRQGGVCTYNGDTITIEALDPRVEWATNSCRP